MTFNTFFKECFVYITLPEQTKPVVAGKFVMTENRQSVVTGKFIYGKSYLARTEAVAVDPVELKLSDKTYETINLNGIFGSLRDASPDYWGRRVIERHLEKEQLDEIDYLLHSPDDRAGALGFGLNQIPPAPMRQFNKTIDLKKLQQIAEVIIRDESDTQSNEQTQIEELILLGTSMGGARPKAVVEDKDALWLAKFNRFDDKWNNAKVEHAMLVLARLCDISVPESRVVKVGGKDVLLVKRFDREKIQDGYTRARMISALTVLKSDEQDREKWSYLLLLEELRRISANPSEDAKELFKRICFNALISNTDDHPRNHALIAKNTNWHLSPAYDLTPTVPISIDRRYLAMDCGDAGREATADNILSQSARFLLKPDQAKQIMDNIKEIIFSSWYSTLRSVGVAEQDCNRLSGAFVYPGFSKD